MQSLNQKIGCPRPLTGFGLELSGFSHEEGRSELGIRYESLFSGAVSLGSDHRTSLAFRGQIWEAFGGGGVPAVFWNGREESEPWAGLDVEQSWGWRGWAC